jgi:amidase
MKGARIGVPSDPADPLNDCYYGKLPPGWVKVMTQAIKVPEDLGAIIVPRQHADAWLDRRAGHDHGRA